MLGFEEGLRGRRSRAGALAPLRATGGVELGTRRPVLRQALVMDCVLFSNESFI